MYQTLDWSKDFAFTVVNVGLTYQRFNRICTRASFNSCDAKQDFIYSQEDKKARTTRPRLFILMC